MSDSHAQNRNQSLSREGEAPAEPHAVSLGPKRKRPAHGVEIDERRTTIVFDTICTKDRERWLASPDVHHVLRNVWKAANRWLVGRYVIMPDHIHMFVAPGKDPVPFENWVKFWKSQFSKQYQTTFPERSLPGRWQSQHWDTRLRRWQAYDEKWEYVRLNPVRHELVNVADTWPYQGEIHRLRWEGSHGRQ